MMRTPEPIRRTIHRMDQLKVPSLFERVAPKLSTKRCVFCNEFLTVIEHAKYLLCCARCGENGQKHVHVDQDFRIHVTETNGVEY